MLVVLAIPDEFGTKAPLSPIIIYDNNGWLNGNRKCSETHSP
jgi:hypothetical protein